MAKKKNKQIHAPESDDDIFEYLHSDIHIYSETIDENRKMFNEIKPHVEKELKKINPPKTAKKKEMSIYGNKSFVSAGTGIRNVAELIKAASGIQSNIISGLNGMHSAKKSAIAEISKNRGKGDEANINLNFAELLQMNKKNGSDPLSHETLTSDYGEDEVGLVENSMILERTGEVEYKYSVKKKKVVPVDRAGKILNERQFDYGRLVQQDGEVVESGHNEVTLTNGKTYKTI